MADIDTAIGRQLRALRQARSMTLSQVAERIGVTPQQIQKYEVGLNRVDAARLFDLSVLFAVPISAFFETLHREGPEEDDLLDSRSHVLAYEFGRLPERQKRAVLSLVRSLSNGPKKKGSADEA